MKKQNLGTIKRAYERLYAAKRSGHFDREKMYRREANEARDCEVQQRHLVERFTEALGSKFIGANPQAREMMLRDIELLRHSDSFSPFRVMHENQTVDMHGICTSVHRHAAQFQIHFRATLAGREVAYALSESAIKHGPIDYLVGIAAYEMAAMLLRDVRECI